VIERRQQIIIARSLEPIIIEAARKVH